MISAPTSELVLSIGKLIKTNNEVVYQLLDSNVFSGILKKVGLLHYRKS